MYVFFSNLDLVFPELRFRSNFSEFESRSNFSKFSDVRFNMDSISPYTCNESPK